MDIRDLVQQLAEEMAKIMTREWSPSSVVVEEIPPGQIAATSAVEPHSTGARAAAGYATSSAEASNGAEEEPEQPVISQALVPASRPMEEEWASVLEEITEARDQDRFADRLREQAWERLNCFMTQFGEAGVQLAGPWPRRLGDKRQSVEAGRAFLRVQRARREAEKEEREAREALLHFQREVERQAAELQQRLNQATRRRLVLGSSSGSPAADANKRCCKCGLAGVARGRDCPNRVNHPDFQYRKPRE